MLGCDNPGKTDSGFLGDTLARVFLLTIPLEVLHGALVLLGFLGYRKFRGFFVCPSWHPSYESRVGTDFSFLIIVTIPIGPAATRVPADAVALQLPTTQ